MKGFLKSRKAWNQFLILVSVCLVSFFLLGLAGTLIVSAVSGVGIKEAADLSNLDFSKPGTLTYIRGMQLVQFISLFVVPVFLCARFFSTDSRRYLGLKKTSQSFYFLAGIAVMLLAIPLTNLLGELNRNIPFPSGMEDWIKRTETEAAQTIQGVLSKHTIKDLVLNVLFIAGLAAVGEELLFRGMAQRLLIKMFKSPWAGIIIAAVLFSAMHLQFFGFLPRFVLGVFLGAIYWYSGSLWAAMIGHFVYDGLLIVLAYFNPEMLNEESTVPFSNLALAGVVSAAIVLLLLGWMKKRSATTYQEVYADDDIPVKDNPF